MSPRFSTHRPHLPGETLQAKAAHLTVGGGILGSGLLLLWSSWDEFSCTAGETTSTGPCGIGIQVSVIVVLFGLILLGIGVVVVPRAFLRPLDPDGAAGWRAGQALAVMACGVIMALMIPRYSCPEGMKLSAVFRFCVSTTRSYQAPSTGFAWKLLALGVGLSLGVVLLRWRSLAWPVATVIVAAAFAFTAGYTAHRTTGLPWEQRSYTIGVIATISNRGP
jgi:hypothetical protein